MTQEDYQKALEWLFVQAPNYQIDGVRAYKPGLQNITLLCEHFGNPQDTLQLVHIGGTNGKGSTSNMLASVVQEAGYSVGLYNSPHLISFTERIKINGEEVSEEFVFEFIQKLKSLPREIRPSFFEFTTVMAFEYFRQKKVDIAIIEVGLGGRLDSTNIITPIASAITNIAMDHMNILGDTPEKIAREKAGIIKKLIPVVTGEEDEKLKFILKEVAESQNAKFIDATAISDVPESDLKGNYQKKNIKVVLALVDILKSKNFKISNENVVEGLQNVQKKTGFIGRWSVISEKPLIICDTAHNEAGLKEVIAQLNSLQLSKHIVLGFVKDKKIEEVLALLPKYESYYFVKPKISRGRNPAEYEDILKASGLQYQIFDTVAEGFEKAQQNCVQDEMIFVGGSNFVVGDLLEYLKNTKA